VASWTTSPTVLLDVVKDQNAGTNLYIRNATSGTAGMTQVRMNSAGGLGILAAMSAGFTTSASWVADSFMVMSADTMSAGLGLAAEGAYPVNIWTNGSRRMTIDSSGNVGIGTTSPGNTLHVEGSTNLNGAVYVGNGTNQAMYFDGGYSAYIKGGGVGHGNALNIWTGSGATAPTITAINGNVGIGTTSPQTTLQVSGGNVAESIPLIISGMTSALVEADDVVGLGFAYNAGLNYVKAGILARASNAEADMDLHFAATNIGGTHIIDISDTKMSILGASGNVGIGTTAPGQKLDVVGKIRVSTQGFQSGASTNTAGMTKRTSHAFGDSGASGSVTTTTMVTITDDGWYDITGFIYSGRNSEGGGVFPFVARRSTLGARTVSVGSAIAGSATVAPTMAWSGNNLQVTHGGYHYGFTEMTLVIGSAPTTVTWSANTGG